MHAGLSYWPLTCEPRACADVLRGGGQVDLWRRVRDCWKLGPGAMGPPAPGSGQRKGDQPEFSAGQRGGPRLLDRGRSFSLLVSPRLPFPASARCAAPEASDPGSGGCSAPCPGPRWTPAQRRGPGRPAAGLGGRSWVAPFEDSHVDLSLPRVLAISLHGLKVHSMLANRDRKSPNLSPR